MDPLRVFGVIAEMSQREPALLSKSVEVLLAQWERGLTQVMLDGDEVIAHATLWRLIEDEDWHELGTVWVRPDRRGHELSAQLYRELFARHPGLNILATTTVAASIKIGAHVGLKMIPYNALPERIRAATCCCPRSKTGVDDNRRCQLREQSCFVRVTSETWCRLGHPPTLWHPLLPEDIPGVLPDLRPPP